MGFKLRKIISFRMRIVRQSIPKYSPALISTAQRVAQAQFTSKRPLLRAITWYVVRKIPSHNHHRAIWRYSWGEAPHQPKRWRAHVHEIRWCLRWLKQEVFWPWSTHMFEVRRQLSMTASRSCTYQFRHLFIRSAGLYATWAVLQPFYTGWKELTVQ